MRVVILDVNGVIMEKADWLLINRALSVYGAGKVLPILVSYRLGVLSREQKNLIRPMVAWAEDHAEYMPFALDAIGALGGESGTEIKICSNFASGTDADERLRAKLSKDTGIVYENITLLPVGENKFAYYQKEREAVRGGALWVFDDSRRNIKAARKAGADYAFLVNAKTGLRPLVK